MFLFYFLSEIVEISLYSRLKFFHLLSGQSQLSTTAANTDYPRKNTPYKTWSNRSTEPAKLRAIEPTCYMHGLKNYNLQALLTQLNKIQIPSLESIKASMSWIIMRISH